MEFFEHLSYTGFLFHAESLLSTQGNEQGMLGDTRMTFEELNRVRFQFRRLESEEGSSNSAGTSGCLYRLVVPDEGA
jgi:hypothetical protein